MRDGAAPGLVRGGNRASTGSARAGRDDAGTRHLAAIRLLAALFEQPLVTERRDDRRDVVDDLTGLGVFEDVRPRAALAGLDDVVRYASAEENPRQTGL